MCIQHKKMCVVNKSKVFVQTKMNFITGDSVPVPVGSASAIPSIDNRYDVGSSTKRWRDGRFVNLYAGSTNVGTQLTSLDATKLSLTGGALTGQVTTNQTPSAADQLVPKSYVDTADALQLNLAGGALTGQVTTNQTPSASDQLVPKSYVDAVGTRATALETKTQLQTLGFHYGNVTQFTDRLMVYNPTYQRLLITTNDSLGAQIESLESATNTYRPLNVLGTNINVHATGMNTLSCGDASSILLNGTASVLVGKDVTSDKFVTRNGTFAQFVKGDGTLDSVGYLPLIGGALTGQVTTNQTPSAYNQLVPKSYVDAGDALQLNLAGGALTGQVTTNQTPSASNQLVPKSYVDTFLPKTGGVLTGNVTSNSQLIGGGAKILTFGLNWIAGPFTGVVYATVNGTADSPAQNGGSAVPLITTYLPATIGTVGYYFKSVHWNFENDPGGEVSIDLLFGNTPYTISAATIASQKIGTAQIDIPPYYTSIRVGLANESNGLIRTGRTIIKIGYY